MTNEYDNHFITLQKALNEYFEATYALCDGNEALKKFIRDKLTTGNIDYKLFGEMSWEKRNFWGHGGQVSIYTSLQRILKDTYQVNTEILRSLNTKMAPEQ